MSKISLGGTTLPWPVERESKAKQQKIKTEVAHELTITLDDAEAGLGSSVSFLPDFLVLARSRG